MDGTTEAWRSSIGARVTAVHALLTAAVADLTVDQVNHVERPGVLPIAFSLMHVVGSEDRVVTRHLHGGKNVWDSAGWAERVGLDGPIPYRGTPVDEAMRVRFRHIEQWREYQRDVFVRTEHALANAPLAVFDEDAFPEGRPRETRPGFLSLLVPEGRVVRVRDICEAYFFQHGARHLGEIEHARALVGLVGLS